MERANQDIYYEKSLFSWFIYKYFSTSRIKVHVSAKTIWCGSPGEINACAGYETENQLGLDATVSIRKTIEPTSVD